MMSIFRRARKFEDFSAEVQAHLDLETDRLVAEGWSPEAARDAAHRAFGNATLVRERFYETSRWVWLEQFVQDLRYAARVLRQHPAFLATAVLTLTVGIGLVTVAFTVFNAYVLRPFAVRQPASLYQIGWRSPNDGGQSFRWREYEELRGRRELFDAVVAERTRFVTSGGRPIAAALVSDNYFEALGPAVLIGRPFTSADAGETAVVSHQAWTRLFARDPAVVGRPLDLNGRRFTIVAVLRPEFTGLADLPRDVWVPFATYAAVSSPELLGADQARAVEVTARLRAGVSPAQAQAALESFMRHAAEAKAGEQVRADVRQAAANPLSLQLVAVLSPVFAAFGLVLVTACANVSNVMLARAIARHREIAVRLSLGASRGRVVRQLLAEGLLIAVIAGFGGLALAAFSLRAGTAIFFRTLPASVAALLRLVPTDIDHRVFVFTFVVAVAATLMFALVPALQASRLRLTDALRGQGGSVRHTSRLRGALVVAQVAVSLILVIVAATLARNGAAIGSIDLGYETDGVLSLNVRGSQNGLVPQLASVLESDPRVAELAVTQGNPLFIRSRPVAAAAGPGRAAAATRYTFVSPEYFSLLRIPLVRGRGFRTDEARSASRVAIVSAATASTLWPGEDPIGRTLRIEPPDGRPVDELPGYAESTVIGIAPDVVSGMILDGPDAGHIYFPMSADNPHAIALLVRGRTPNALDPVTLQELFRRVVSDPQVFEALPLGEMRALQIYPLQAASWVGSLLGLVALVLSVSGLYGVLTYTLNQRAREIGIRMALGATASAVVRLVVNQSARLAGVGAAIGAVVAFATLRILGAAVHLRTFAFLDMPAFAAGLGIVMAAAALAAFQPARRATQIDPALALRADA